MLKRVLVVLSISVLLGACSEATRPVPPRPGPTAAELLCTAIGGMNGVGVHIPAELWVTSGTIVFRVCDEDGCVNAQRRLRPFPPRNISGPEERMAVANINGFGRRFQAGIVTMTAEIHGPDGALLASRTQATKLVRYWPNGKEGDGDGFLSGGFEMKPGDRV